MALIRYPGSKAKLLTPIINRLPDQITLPIVSMQDRWEYREPFFGAGAVGFHILERINARCRVWLNDKDYWLVCLWKTVMEEPRGLIQQIRDFKPTAEAFYQFKQQDGDKTIDPELAGFRKLACHQMSISGFGVKSGGPLGGKDQLNANYPVDCRWNRLTLEQEVKRLNRIFGQFKTPPVITCKDFTDLLTTAPRQKCAIYIDPPYVKQGAALYKHAMTEEQHRKLAQLVGELKCSWAVSYDDDPLIREIYGRFIIEELPVVYTNATNAKGARRKNHEVLIRPAI